MFIRYDPDVFTWSCHWGGLVHCGECNGCIIRKNRYESAGVEDPTPYGVRARKNFV